MDGALNGAHVHNPCKGRFLTGLQTGDSWCPARGNAGSSEKFLLAAGLLIFRRADCSSAVLGGSAEIASCGDFPRSQADRTATVADGAPLPLGALERSSMKRHVKVHRGRSAAAPRRRDLLAPVGRRILRLVGGTMSQALGSRR